MGKSLSFTEAVDRLHEWRQRVRGAQGNITITPFSFQAISRISNSTQSLNTKKIEEIKRLNIIKIAYLKE